MRLTATLDMQSTPFQRRVRELLREVSAGRTVTSKMEAA
jgi:O6-methylguanine-DNA--protein-cysteine methyltransferase